MHTYTFYNMTRGNVNGNKIKMKITGGIKTTIDEKIHAYIPVNFKSVAFLVRHCFIICACIFKQKVY